MAIGTVNIKLDSGPHTQLQSLWMSCGLWEMQPPRHHLEDTTQVGHTLRVGGSWGKEQGCAQPTPSQAAAAHSSPGRPVASYRQHGRLQLQHLIPRLWGVLKFCVVLPLLDFGKESPSPVPLLWARPLACDLDKSTDCHSCSHRGTIKHLLKSTKYLHP